MCRHKDVGFWSRIQARDIQPNLSDSAGYNRRAAGGEATGRQLPATGDTAQQVRTGRLGTLGTVARGPAAATARQGIAKYWQLARRLSGTGQADKYQDTTLEYNRWRCAQNQSPGMIPLTFIYDSVKKLCSNSTYFYWWLGKKICPNSPGGGGWRGVLTNCRFYKILTIFYISTLKFVWISTSTKTWKKKSFNLQPDILEFYNI